MTNRRGKSRSAAPAARAVILALAASLAQCDDGGNAHKAAAASSAVEDPDQHRDLTAVALAAEAPSAEVADDANIDEHHRDLQASQIKRLATPFRSDRSTRGIMFDVKAKSALVVGGLDVNLLKTTTSTTIEIWTKKGGHDGFENDRSAWTLWLRTTITGKGANQVTVIPRRLFDPLKMKQGERWAFYVTTPGGSYLRYQSTVPKNFFMTEDLIISGNGAEKRAGGFSGATVSPRMFSGALVFKTTQRQEKIWLPLPAEFDVPTPAQQSRPNPAPAPRPNPAPIWLPLPGDAVAGVSNRPPTRRPTANRPPTPRPSRRPSPRPTPRPSRRPTPRPTPRPTRKPVVVEPTGQSFRLRLYWEKGYMWQESKKEEEYCMECRSPCEHGDYIYIDDCDSTSRQRFYAVGNTLRPVRGDGTLCLTDVRSVNDDRPIRALRCDGGDEQKWDGFQYSGKFELHPRKQPDRCLTQQHHPRRYEKVFHQECQKPRGHDTAGWITY